MLRFLTKAREERVIPGLNAPGKGETRYYRVKAGEDADIIFRRLFKALDAPRASDGGANEAGCIVTTSDGHVYHGVTYVGDVAAWRGDLEESAGAQRIGLAAFRGERFVLQNGHSYAMGELVIRLL